MTFRDPVHSMLGVLAALTMGGAVAAAPPDAAEDGDHEPSRPRDEVRPMNTHGYLNGGIGYGAVDLTTFVAEKRANGFTAELLPTAAGGPAADLGVGLRVSTLTLGVRGRVIALQDSEAERTVGGHQLWNLDAELGLRVPFGRIEGHLMIAGGYSKFGGLNDALRGAKRGVDIDGANARLGLGVDYFVSQALSLGVRGAAGVLFLSRSAIPLRELAYMEEVGTISEAEARVLEGDGTTVGTSYQIVAGPGVHF